MQLFRISMLTPYEERHKRKLFAKCPPQMVFYIKPSLLLLEYSFHMIEQTSLDIQRENMSFAMCCKYHWLFVYRFTIIKQYHSQLYCLANSILGGFCFLIVFVYFDPFSAVMIGF